MWDIECRFIFLFYEDLFPHQPFEECKGGCVFSVRGRQFLRGWYIQEIRVLLMLCFVALGPKH